MVDNLMNDKIQIELIGVDYTYAQIARPAVVEVNLMINRGEFVGIIGPNASGKTTLLKLMNGLIIPAKGDVIVDGINTKDKDDIYEIRRKIGMVFSNPENQIVASVVEEDVAFGVENLGIPPSEIQSRVRECLIAVGLEKEIKRAPHLLSCGQQQRLVIAGVLAMKPDCILLDEPTALLDPAGRIEMMRIIKRLNRENKITIILVSHFMEEMTGVDRLLVMDQGRIIMDKSPRDVFIEKDLIDSMGLELPIAAEISLNLQKRGMLFKPGILTVDELAAHICSMK